MRSSRLTLIRCSRNNRLAVQYLEDRTAPAVDMFYDAMLGDVTIIGSDLGERLTLFADIDGNIRATNNGKLLQALDPNTNLPVQPTVWNTDSIQARLGAGNDVFDLFADRLGQVGAYVDYFFPPIQVFGEAGNDVLMLHVPAVQSPTEVEPPPPFPLGIRFEGGDGLADSFRLIGTDVAERVDAVSMQDFHDLTFGDVGSVLQKVRALAFGTERVFIDAGGGDNRIAYRLSGPPGIVPWVVDLRSGDGNDHIRVNLDGGSDDVTARVDSGSGDDVVELDGGELLPPKLDCKIDLGLGEDLFILETLRPPPQSPVPQPGPDPGPEFRLNLRAGGGNDRINALLESVGLIAVWNVAMGDGDDVLDLNVTTPDSFQLTALGGAGADVLDLVGLTTPDDNHFDIFANLGTHDDVMSFHWQPADPMAQGGSLDLRMTAITGTGADVVDLSGIVAASANNRLNITANLGAQNDEFACDLRASGTPVITSTTNLRLNVLGGAGNDIADVSAHVLPFNWISNIAISLASGADMAVVGIVGPDMLPPTQGALSTQNVVMNGGLGNDVMEARLDLSTNFAIRGNVSVLGSAGNDNLALFPAGISSAMSLTIDGGSGKDTAEKRGNVKVLSC